MHTINALINYSPEEEDQGDLGRGSEGRPGGSRTPGVPGRAWQGHTIVIICLLFYFVILLLLFTYCYNLPIVIIDILFYFVILLFYSVILLLLFTYCYNLPIVLFCHSIVLLL